MVLSNEEFIEFTIFCGKIFAPILERWIVVDRGLLSFTMFCLQLKFYEWSWLCIYDSDQDPLYKTQALERHKSCGSDFIDVCTLCTRSLPLTFCSKRQPIIALNFVQSYSDNLLTICKWDYHVVCRGMI